LYLIAGIMLTLFKEVYRTLGGEKVLCKRITEANETGGPTATYQIQVFLLLSTWIDKIMHLSRSHPL